MYLNIYSCIWRGLWFCSLGRTYPHHRTIVWPVQTSRSGRFSAILGYFRRFWWGTAILGVFGGGTAQKRLDPNVRLCGQVVLSFGLQPLAPLHHRLTVSQPFPSSKCKFSRVKHGKFCPCSMPIYTAVLTRSKLYTAVVYTIYSCVHSSSIRIDLLSTTRVVDLVSTRSTCTMVRRT